MKNIDMDTLLVGKIKTVADAKRLLKAGGFSLPRMGYEKLCDSGVTEITRNMPGTVWNGNHSYDYRTWLSKEACGFRVRTHISIEPH